MSRPLRALFLYIPYCKHVHMYSSTVICTALPHVYTVTYHIHNTIQHYLVLLYFLYIQRTLQAFKPGTSTLIGQVIKLLKYTCPLSLFLFNTRIFQAHVLNSSVFRLICSLLYCQRAHQRVGAPRCITRTCC